MRIVLAMLAVVVLIGFAAVASTRVLAPRPGDGAFRSSTGATVKIEPSDIARLARERKERCEALWKEVAEKGWSAEFVARDCHLIDRTSRP